MPRLSPLKAIRAKCMDCSGQSFKEVRTCPVKSCPLWVYRMGKHPGRKREMTEEQRQAAVERLAKARAKQQAAKAQGGADE